MDKLPAKTQFTKHWQFSPKIKIYYKHDNITGSPRVVQKGSVRFHIYTRDMKIVIAQCRVSLYNSYVVLNTCTELNEKKV